ncbi:MAG: hypothetical protein GKR95_08855 [Gammaproteobacteria bacterium]|nr:hypothetical protein [Gammaproteobacteria bacterium]
MPSSIDLREYQTPIRNQSRRTCTTFCSIAALEAAYKRAGYGDTDLSEGFFIYMIKTFWLDNWSRVERRGAEGRETQIGFGSGGNGPESLELLASGLKIPNEAVWPFRSRNFTERDHPWIANPYNSPFWQTQEKVSEFNLAEGFLERSHTLAGEYYSAEGFNLINKDDGFIDQLETVLAMGHEVVLDFGINYTIENPDDESARLWRSNGPGGESHCVLLVGFNRESRDPDEHYFIAKNSWGKESRTARSDGFTYLSYDVLRVNAHRAGYITGVTEPEPWPELGFVGRWDLVKGNWNGRIDIYHIPGIMQSVLNKRSGSERLTDRRIGTFYGCDGAVLRVNGSIYNRTIDLYIQI